MATRAHGSIPDEYWEVFADATIWAGVAEEEVERLASLAVVRKCAQGEVLGLEGTRPSTVHIVLSGTTRAVHYDSSGQAVVLETVQPGKSIGAFSACLDLPLAATSEALEGAVVASLPAAEIRELFYSNLPFAHAVTRAYAERYQNLAAVLLRNTVSVPRRLASYLLSLPKEAHVDGFPVVTLPFSRQMLAELLATTPETLSRTFRKLQESKLIASRDGLIALLDEDALTELSESSDG